MHMRAVALGNQMEASSSGAGVPSGCELPDVGAGNTSDLVEEQYTLLTTEPPLCPLHLDCVAVVV